MTWGKSLLDPKLYEAQERAAKAAANPWGAALGLPVDPDVAESASEETAPAATTLTDPPKETMSAATIEQRLAEDPGCWPDMLALEIDREAPRKSVLRAIIRTAKENGGDPDAIAKAEAFLAAL